MNVKVEFVVGDSWNGTLPAAIQFVSNYMDNCFSMMALRKVSDVIHPGPNVGIGSTRIGVKSLTMLVVKKPGFTFEPALV